MKPPFKVEGRINYARKKIIDEYISKGEDHTIMLCGRVCKYDPLKREYIWWQYAGFEIIKAENIWGKIKELDERGRAIVFSFDYLKK